MYSYLFSSGYEGNKANPENIDGEMENGITVKKSQKSLIKMILILIVTLIMCFFAAFEIPDNSQAQNDQPQRINYNNQNGFIQQIDSMTYPAAEEPRSLLTAKPLLPKRLLPVSSIKSDYCHLISKRPRPFNMIKKILDLPINIFMNILRVLNLFKN